MMNRLLVLFVISIILSSCNSGTDNGGSKNLTVADALEVGGRNISADTNVKRYNFKIDQPVALENMKVSIYPASDCSGFSSASINYPAATPAFVSTPEHTYNYSQIAAYQFVSANAESAASMQSVEFRTTTDVPFQFVKCVNGKFTNSSGGACTANSCGFVTTDVGSLTNNVVLGTISSSTNNFTFTIGQLNYKDFQFSLTNSNDIVNLEITVISNKPDKISVNSSACTITGNSTCSSYVSGFAQESAVLTAVVPRYNASSYNWTANVDVIPPSFGYTWMGGANTVSGSWNGTLPPYPNPYPGARVGVASWLYNGNIYYFSGRSASASSIFYSDFWIYNIASNTWSVADNDSMIWVTSNTSAPSSIFNGMAFGSGVFTIVGNGGSVATSSDGLTWTSRTSGTTANFNAITYGENLFVAVGNAVIRTSTNGTTWTNRTTAGSGIYRAVAYSGTDFVVVGDAGNLRTSPDGATWTSQSAGSLNYKGVTYGNSIFVAVGDGGIIRKSSNTTGTAGWTTTLTSNTSNNLRAITYANNTFVTVGDAGTIVTSNDGTTWTIQKSGTASNLTSVTYNGKLFVAVGAGGITITSPDGIIWTIANDNSINNFTGVFALNNLVMGLTDATSGIFNYSLSFLNTILPSVSLGSSVLGSNMGTFGTATPFLYTDPSNNVFACLFGGQSIYQAPSSAKFRANIWCRQIAPSLSIKWVLKQGPAIDNSNANLTTALPSSPNKNDDSTSNYPSPRGLPAKWDTGRYLWIYGGQQTNSGSLNDLWRYDKINNSWAFMSGSAISATTLPVRGVIGVEDPSYNPGCRYAANGFVGKDGYLYLYGGIQALGATNPYVYSDMWRYNTKTNMWAWVSGSSTVTAGTPLLPSYGTKLIQSPANTPGGRFSGVTYTDSAGNFWLYGGRRTTTSYYADLWVYNSSADQWTFVTGPTTGTSPNLQPVNNFVGAFPPLGVESSGALMPAFALSSLEINSNGDLYFFSGGNQDTANAYNTLWKFSRGN